MHERRAFARTRFDVPIGHRVELKRLFKDQDQLELWDWEQQAIDLLNPLRDEEDDTLS